MRMAFLCRQLYPSVAALRSPLARKPPLCRRLSVASGPLRAAQRGGNSSAALADEDNLLDRLRSRRSKEGWSGIAREEEEGRRWRRGKGEKLDYEDSLAEVSTQSFDELGLAEELRGAIEELDLKEPTEVQRMAIPAILDGENVVVASHTGSGKTLAYMLPLVQSLRKDEIESGRTVRARKPRALVLCPTRELTEQVLQVAKSLSHHARFRSAMISGGFRPRPQADALNGALDMVVGTPGRLLMHVEEGNLAFGDIKYVVIDEADTMFDRGFGPELKKIIDPLRNRALRNGSDFQTILVTATITKSVQKLLDTEFPGIRHIFTSTLHKKVDTSRHFFQKVPGNINKLEALVQVLEPALAKGSRCMVFCRSVDSCRAVDHYLNEMDVHCVNYHGEVPAEDRIKNLAKFKIEDGEGPVPALICTDLAARGLDLQVDHVINFDFPSTSIDYLHRSGRTARMGLKGRVTSLVTKRELALANRLEDAMRRNETLEGVSLERERVLGARMRALKSRYKEAFDRAAAKGVNLEKVGTRALAMAKAKARRIWEKECRKKFASKVTKTGLSKTRGRTKALIRAERRRKFMAKEASSPV
ncbi:DEAD-box ATP-dependent RNA helicase 39 [Selaginella moellendorffii]|uniref:DEAD-box ATP-dependent RNA helicase 39 n=1 Tax=Selaginella moellendorffii TaxID=88036 RepID=UPI000D1C97B0|nr:DEAD-box ATP-dependent RNA helicase 39 [Selaginella moellendorffii]|eukprot:XP_024539001.1 DEAD-box ATP-dependent RNA helicase 39 [Selaginella moellendorffii]